ncbi:MAG: hypothetical protein JWM74_2481 [Myxococcaceae bacterium]|nr:hypothetical protein [Myxococcaceae bacterium]
MGAERFQHEPPWRMGRSRSSLALPWLLLLLASCRASSPVDLPRRAAPSGYPAPHAQALPEHLASIPEEQFARALAGRTYRVRWGTFPPRCEDCAVDARSGSFPMPAEGPFETDVRVVASDVSVRIVTGPANDRDAPSPQRLIACVDIKPSGVPQTANRDTIVLDVQPLGDDPPMPLVVDAVTGERLPLDAGQLADEYSKPCDGRVWARQLWDENLKRVHGVRLH